MTNSSLWVGLSEESYSRVSVRVHPETQEETYIKGCTARDRPCDCGIWVGKSENCRAGFMEGQVEAAFYK